MGLVDSLRDIYRTFTAEDYDEYDDDAAYRGYDAYQTPNSTSTAPDYALHRSRPMEEPVPRPSAVPDPAVSTIAMLSPESLESVRAAADHLLQNRAVILSLQGTDPTLARRWLDYLGGTIYSLDGKINRIAAYTYLLTPKNVQLVAGFEGEN